MYFFVFVYLTLLVCELGAKPIFSKYNVTQ